VSAVITESLTSKLRDYQLEAIEAAHAAVAKGVRRFAIELPTGSGKTYTFVTWSADFGGRVLVLVHTDELVRQTVEAFREHRPDVELGVVKAELNEHRAPVVIASVQTLSRPSRLEQIEPDFEAVIVDEAHHATASTWRRVLDYFAESDPVISGWTATAFRADDSELIGETGVFQEIAYSKPIAPMIAEGHLCDVVAKTYQLGYDLDGVRSTAGDYSARGLTDVMRAVNAAPLIVEAYRRELAGKRAICYTPTTDLAEEVAGAFRADGIRAEMIEAKTPLEARRGVIERYRAGETPVVCNAMILTEGFNEPRTEGILLARPTKSPVLFRQIIGRGLRPYPGKDRCVILDFTGATRRHDLVSINRALGVDMLSGESAREAMIRLEVEARAAAATAAERARLVAQAVDLFRTSRARWVADPDGRFFVLWLGEDRQQGSSWLGQGEQVEYDVRYAGAGSPDPEAESWTVHRVISKRRYERQEAGPLTLEAAQWWVENYARMVKADRTVTRAPNTRSIMEPSYTKLRAVYEKFTRRPATLELTVAAASEAVSLHFATRRYLSGRR
jgi:superfamily II DNA or RNA helicase